MRRLRAILRRAAIPFRLLFCWRLLCWRLRFRRTPRPPRVRYERTEVPQWLVGSAMGVLFLFVVFSSIFVRVENQKDEDRRNQAIVQAYREKWLRTAQIREIERKMLADEKKRVLVLRAILKKLREPER